MTIDEVKTEVRKIEKYYDFNHQTNDYDVLVNLTEISNLILIQNKISYNKSIDDLLEDANEMAIEVDTGTYTMKVIGIGLLKKLAEKLKEGGKNEQY